MMILGQKYKEIKSNTETIREHIHFLTTEWIDKGFVDPELEIRIEEAKKILKMLEERGA